MDIKALKLIYNGVFNTQDIMRILAWDNYPYGGCKDAEVEEMFYQLNGIALKLIAKIKELEAQNNESKES